MDLPFSLVDVLVFFVALIGASLFVGVLGLVLLINRIRRIRIPRDADFFTTMRLVPLVLVVLLDIVDLGLDVINAPIVWIILDRMGLPSLRNKAAIEALIPFTGPIPTFTLCWIAARLFNLGSVESTYLEQFARRRSVERPLPPSRRRANIIDMDE